MDNVIAALQYLMLIPVNMLIFFWNIHRNLTIKKKFKVWEYIFPVVFIGIETIIYFSEPISFYHLYIKLILNILLFTHLLTVYNEIFFKKIFVISVTLILMASAELILHITTLLIGAELFDINVISITQVMLLTYFNFLAFTILSVFTYLYKKKSFQKRNYGFTNFALVPFSQVILYELLFLNYTKESFNRETFIVLFLGTIVTVIADIFLFKGVKSIREANRNKIKIAELEYNQKLSYSYYQNIQQNIEQTMKYRHDFNNMISTVYTMISSDNISESIRFLNEMKEKNFAAEIPVFCNNPVINSIIYDKKVLSEKMLIDFRFSLDIPEQLDIELTDLCSIFTNLIDNAFDSACKSKNKTVELNVWCELGYLFVRTINYPDTINDISPRKKHSSDDIHGYGLHILNDISEKYDGCFNIESSDDKVLAVCSVKC